MSFKFTTALMAGCLSVTVLQAQQLTADAATTSFIKQYDVLYTQALLKNNPASLSAYYTTDAWLMPEYQLTLQGKAPVATYYQAFLSRFTVEQYHRSPIEVLDLGELVTHLGLFEMTIRLKSTGQSHTLKGKYFDIWEKQATGDPLLIMQAWNYSHPIDFGDQLKFADVPGINISLAGHVPVTNNLSFEIAAINRLTEGFITEHNATMWSMLYGEDAKLLYSNHPIYEGKEAITAFLEKHTQEEIPVFEKLDIRTNYLRDLGYFVLEYASHIAMVKNGDWSGVGTGKNIVLWKKNKEGFLKIFRGVGMYD